MMLQVLVLPLHNLRGGYIVGNSVDVTVVFGSSVTVDTTNGTPSLELDIDGNIRTATYASGSGTTNLIFSYTVQNGDSDANGDGIAIIADSLALDGGSIDKTADGAAAILPHLAVTDNASHRIDAGVAVLDVVSPVLRSTLGAVGAGSTVTLTFDEIGSGLKINTIDTNDFVFSGIGLSTGAETINSVSVNHNAQTVTLNLNGLIKLSDTNLQVTYTPDDDANDIQDINSNKVLGFTASVVNTMPSFDVNSNSMAFDTPSILTVSDTNKAGEKVGDKILYSNIISINGQSIDAIVTTTALNNITISSADLADGNNSQETDPLSTTPESLDEAWYKLNTNVKTAGGDATITFDFIKSGSYNASNITASKGVDVLLENVPVNSYDLDIAGQTKLHYQYQEFGGFASYTVSNNTNLSQAQNTGFTRFETGLNKAISDSPGTLEGDKIRIMALYESIHSFSLKTGAVLGGSSYFYIDFSKGPNWIDSPPVTESVSGVSFDISRSKEFIDESQAETSVFTVSMSGKALVGQQTATVNLDSSGGATNITDYGDFYAAVDAGLMTGVTRSGSILTFTSEFNNGAGVGSFDFDITAINDSSSEGNETVIATLSNPSHSITTNIATIETDTATTTITDVGVPPVIDLDALTTGSTSYSNTFDSTTGTPVNVTNTDATVTDSNDSHMKTFTIVAGGNLVDGTDERVIFKTTSSDISGDLATNFSIRVMPVGSGIEFRVKYTESNKTFVIEDNANSANELLKADVDALMRAMQYENSKTDPTVGERTFSFTANDGGSNSNTAISTIIITGVSFALTSTPTISEESTETSTFTLTMTGFPLGSGQTSTIDIEGTGTATNGGTDYTSTMLAVIQAKADATTGVSFDGTKTLTFTDAFVGSTFTYDLTAVNDGVADNNETIIGTLTNATTTSGSASIVTPVATTTITDTDGGVSFALTSTPTINEESTETSTFTLTMTGFPLSSGQTSTIDIEGTGTATNGGTDYTSTMLAVIQAKADATTGVSFDGTKTLTFTDAFVGSTFTYDLTAVNDGVADNNETIIGTLTNATTTSGSASIVTPVATTTITDTDGGVSFALTSTPTINEESTETSTFTLTMTGFPLSSGQTSAIDIEGTGTATNGGLITPQRCLLLFRQKQMQQLA
ncbi:MAG: hypothetical protein Q9M50_02625 [Methylococcales bacterium]|nr:hypothetical protein [Methylococcales bacterium]